MIGPVTDQAFNAALLYWLDNPRSYKDGMTNQERAETFMTFVETEIAKMEKAEWTRAAPAMWDLANGIAFCRALERRLADKWHVSLGGSVLYNGFSHKDLDVVVRAHSKTGNVSDVTDMLHTMGFVPNFVADGYKEVQSNMVISVYVNPNTGHRVDVFVVTPDKPTATETFIPF